MMFDITVATALAEDAATLALLHDREITLQMLNELDAVGFPDNLSLLPIGEISRNSYELMRKAIPALLAADEKQLDDELAADFASIYLTGAYGASPSESFWLSDDHLLCQEAMFDMRALYASSGLAAPDWRKRPDDHLVFQLEFLSRRLAATETEDDWRLLVSFLDYHLLRWLPEFSARVVERSETPFYAALAYLTDAWCQQVRNLLATFLNETRPTPEQIEAVLSPRRESEPVAVPLRFIPGGASPSW